MRILVSNDDGVTAPGLQALVRAFSEAGHTLFVCAPDAQRSAASHSMTLTDPLCAKPVVFPGAEAAWAVSGTPVDCVKLALGCLTENVDFVLSGINHGYNIGTDTLYSGTVAAALEGVLCGVPGMAVSLEEREENYEEAARIAVRVTGELPGWMLGKHKVVNLNVPAGKPRGTRATALGSLVYDGSYDLEREENGVRIYRLTAEMGRDTSDSETDCSWLRRGYATITILDTDLSCREETMRLAKIASCDF